jgi:hypothetical protein
MLNGGVTERAEVKPGAGEETFDERGPVLHPFEPGLDQGGELGEVAFGQVGQGPFQVRPHLLNLEPAAHQIGDPRQRPPLIKILFGR